MSGENPASAETSLAALAAKRFNESILIAGLWLILMMQGQSPLGSTPLVWSIIAAIFCGIVVSKNLTVAWGLVFGGLLFFRVHFPISSWNDQHWIQWYSSTAVLTGHNPFTPAELTQVSWANYFPTGSLFGALWLNLGIHSYWVPWHALNLCLFSIPFAFNPSLRNLIVFMAVGAYFPLADYTGGGGTLEIGYALLIGGIYLLKERQTIPAIVILAYGCLFRQPHVFVFAFVAIILWERKERHAVFLFTLLTLIFGGVFALANPRGFLDATFRAFEAFGQLWFNQNGGLRANYSISTVLLSVGLPEALVWTGFKAFYLPVMLLGVGALLIMSWVKRKQEEWVIGAMLLSIPWIYFMSRGFVMYHYLVAACFPFAVLLAESRPNPGNVSKTAKGFTRAVTVMILVAGLTPLAFWLWAILGNAFRASLEESRPGPETITVGAASIPVTQSVRSKLNEPIVFKYPEPVAAEAVRIVGRKSGPITLHAVEFKAWPPDGVVTRVITQGELWASEDGVAYWLLKEFRSGIDYNVYPLEIRFTNSKPFRFLKLVGRKAVGQSDEIEFQNLLLLKEPHR